MGDTEWKFRPRVYPHFDHVIHTEYEARALIKNFQKTGKHSFMPFIECPLETRRFSKHLEKLRLIESGENPHNIDALRVKKPRPIKYASHQDSQIYSYYRAILASQYEKLLISFNLTNYVIAYRKIATIENPEKGKCNIHYAKEAFDEIVNRGQSTAITIDIKGFFESLDHEFLYKKWCQILEVE